MLSRAEAQERVARGAAKLDDTSPGWAATIDQGRLTMSDSRHCMACQVGEQKHGEWEPYINMAIRMFGPACYEVLTRAVVAHGFQLTNADVLAAGENEASYALLQECWIEAIADRLMPVTEEPETAHVGVVAV